jgi:hypothetical protein
MTKTAHSLTRDYFITRTRKTEKKATISFVVSIYPSVHTELGYHWTDFHEILYLSVFRKSVKKIQVSLQSDNNGYFT